MKDRIAKIVKSKVFENYFSMTSIHAANLVIGLLLYPYLIRILGRDTYGTYIFAVSIVSFFRMVINFGFDMPALKRVSISPKDVTTRNRTNSEVFSAKVMLTLVASVAFASMLALTPFFKNQTVLYSIVFMSVVTEIIAPSWFFQATQNMKVLTITMLGSKILYIPLIFILIKKPSDILVYASIISVSAVLASLVAFLYLRIKEKLAFRFIKIGKLKSLFTDSLPFFWTFALSTAKEQSVTLIIGAFFGMKDVAIYDLANKIVNSLRLFTQSINSALFPKIIVENSSRNIQKTIKYETYISLIIIALIVIFGYWAVVLLGGKEMWQAYPMSIILSFSVYSYLIVGCYLNFVFVGANKYYFVTKNQIVAFVAFMVLCGIFLIISKNIFLVVMAYSLSHLVEIIYCKYLISKHKLL